MFIDILKRFLYQKMIEICIDFPKWLSRRFRLHNLRDIEIDTGNDRIDNFNIIIDGCILMIYIIIVVHLVVYGFFLHTIITGIVLGSICMPWFTWKFIFPWLKSNWVYAREHVSREYYIKSKNKM